jgi:molybdenum cofactor cytidylyltransferase
MEAAGVAIALLAAGKAVRFGSDKLLAEVSGIPMGEHAAAHLAQLNAGAYFAVCRPDASISRRYTSLGFQILENGRPDLGQSHSLHLAVDAALRTDATALLVALADMPFVPAEHFTDLISGALIEVVASSDGENAMPPAIFPRAYWPKLLETSGDAGARHLLRDAKRIFVSADCLRDIDSPADLPSSK